MFGVKMNDSIIPPMPQPPAKPLSPLDAYAREGVQEENRKQAEVGHQFFDYLEMPKNGQLDNELLL